MKDIAVYGAREHNLKNINVVLPKEKIVVITGLSGSGKSSLAFDTIYREGQRRYLESLSSYVRQFIGQQNKPKVERIEGLSPSIAIDQKTTSHNPRSTVGTVTEIYDYLRLLYTHIGIPYCPKCNVRLKAQTIVEIVDDVLKKFDAKRIMIIAPVVMGRKGEFADTFKEINRKGFVRILVDGKMYHLPEFPALEKNKKHTIEVVIDRLSVTGKNKSRIYDSVETGVKLTDGIIKIGVFGGQEYIFSTKLSCPKCGLSFPEITPRIFSFNNPFGACPACEGLGVKKVVDERLLVKHPRLSIYDGAIPFIKTKNTILSEIEAVARQYGFSLNTPFSELPEEHRKLILYGTKGQEVEMEYISSRLEVKMKRKFEGIIPKIERLYTQTTSQGAMRYYLSFMNELKCPVCKGKRLKKTSLSVRIRGKSISDFTEMSVLEEYAFISNLSLTKKEESIAHDLIKEILERLKFLIDVGLGYLNLARNASTLSGGENQRIRLGTQIGSALQGIIYVLDEPSIGLHQRDNDRLINTLKELKAIGNTVIVVEHDRDMILNADYVVDMGPGAGIHGGEVIAAGTPKEIMHAADSLTGKYLSGKTSISVKSRRRNYKRAKKLVLTGAREHNLKGITASFPLNTLICVTGVSGSGKSSLINDTLYPLLKRMLYGSKTYVGAYKTLRGIEHIEDVVIISQEPIGRTPRSNPATYTNVFTPIRELFSRLPLSRMRGYTPSRFSFNVKGGRCEACEGGGIIKIGMNFMPDVYITCEECHGSRYNRETLEVEYDGKTISDVLNMTVNQALEFFANHNKIRMRLQMLADVGLGYIKLGQSATTLSGGEAQRIKLASELAKKQKGGTIYLLDEPTTGLHFDDVKKLLKVLDRLTDKGNTVVVIEHNLDVIKNADYIIDLGPEGGEAGGSVVAEGSPEDVAKCADSFTGQYLREYLNI